MSLLEHLHNASASIRTQDFLRAADELRKIREWGVNHASLGELINGLEVASESGGISDNPSLTWLEAIVEKFNKADEQLFELREDLSTVMGAFSDNDHWISLPRQSELHIDFRGSGQGRTAPEAAFESIELFGPAVQSTQEDVEHAHAEVQKHVDNDPKDFPSNHAEVTRDVTRPNILPFGLEEESIEEQSGPLSSTQVSKLVELASASQEEATVNPEDKEDGFWAGRSALDLAGFEPVEYDFQHNAPIKKLKAQATVLSAALKTVESALQELSEVEETAGPDVPTGHELDDVFLPENASANELLDLGEAFSSEALGAIVDQSFKSTSDDLKTRPAQPVPDVTSPPPIPRSPQPKPIASQSPAPRVKPAEASPQRDSPETNQDLVSALEASTDQAVAIIIIEQVKRLIMKDKLRSALDVLDDLLSRVHHPQALAIKEQIELRLQSTKSADSAKSTILKRVVSLKDMAQLDIDPKGAFLLSQIDGRSRIEDIVELSAMPHDEANRLLSAWLKAGIVEVVSQ